MCLSTVYTLRGDEKKEVCKNVAAMTVEGDKLVFSDILGVPTAVVGTIEKIDLMENLIFVPVACFPHADLGGGDAVASSKLLPHPLAVNPSVTAAPCHLSCARPSVSTGVPLHKGGFGACVQRGGGVIR